MKHQDKKIRVMVFGCLTILFAACAAGPKPETGNLAPMTLKTAVRSLAADLLDQIEADSGILKRGRINVVLTPFEDADSAEVPQVSKTIETCIIEEARLHYPDFNVSPLNTRTLKDAEYLISGTIGLNAPWQLRSGDKNKRFHVIASARNLKKIKRIGNADVWLSDRDLDYRSLAIYRDNPFYFREAGIKPSQKVRHDDLRKSPQHFVADLQTRAILEEASAAYEKRDYETARQLFEKAETRRSRNWMMRVYAGLYMTHRKLGRPSAAEAAFAKLIETSVEQYNTLTVKFLFEVNTENLRKDPNENLKYDMWLRRIGSFLHRTGRCIHVLGHSSQTGSEAWNDQLSLSRAKTIQRMLISSFPDVMKRSRAIGKGYSENIVGIGTDDERDALDRRVEIRLVDCNRL